MFSCSRVKDIPLTVVPVWIRQKTQFTEQWIKEDIVALLFIPEVRVEAGIDTGRRLFSNITDPVSLPSSPLHVSTPLSLVLHSPIPRPPLPYPSSPTPLSLVPHSPIPRPPLPYPSSSTPLSLVPHSPIPRPPLPYP